MKIKELIQMLSGLDREMEVIMSIDGEGNVFKQMSEAYSIGVFEPENSWRGEFYSDEWTAEEAAMDEDDWAEMLERDPVVCLWPVG